MKNKFAVSEYPPITDKRDQFVARLWSKVQSFVLSAILNYLPSNQAPGGFGHPAQNCGFPVLENKAEWASADPQKLPETLDVV